MYTYPTSTVDVTSKPILRLQNSREYFRIDPDLDVLIYCIFNASSLGKKANIVLQKFISFLLYCILRNDEDWVLSDNNRK